MAQEQIKGQAGDLGSGGSLDVYDVPGSAIITPYAISATIDGSGASGSFLPCLTFKTITGAVIARCPAPEVASGDTVEVSWFPRGGVGGGSGSGGIQYDTDNEGDWLYVGTTGTGGEAGGSPFGRPVTFYDAEGGGIFLRSGGTDVLSPGASLDVSDSGLELRTFTPDNDAIDFTIGPHGIDFTGTSASTWTINNSGTGGFVLTAASFVQIQDTSVGVKLAFFGPGGATQQAAPSSVAGIVAALQAYGLLASGGSPITSVGDVTSSDSSLTVTNPTGPTTDLAVAIADGGSA